MRSSRWITLLLGLTLAGVCGLSILSVYGGLSAARSQGIRLAFGSFDSQAVKSERLSFEAPLPTRIVIDSTAGDITLLGGASEQIEVELSKRAWERDPARAEAAAEAMAVAIEREGDTLTLRWHYEERLDLGTRRGGVDAVSFVVRLPDSIASELDLGQGAVTVQAMRSPVRVDARFGDVQVTDVAAPIEIRSLGGGIELQRIEAGDGDIRVSSDHGQLLARRLSGREIELSSSSGGIDAGDIRARAALTLRSDFGDVALEALRAASLEVISRNGLITIADGELDGRVEVTNDFGDTGIEGLTANAYILTSRNGAVRLVDARGRVQIRSDFGDIEVRALEPVALQLESSNGAIDFAGRLEAGASHRLHSDFGGLRLALPADSRLDLSTATEFGTFKSALPVEISGDMDPTDLEGKINGGGARLELGSRNGDIVIEALSDSPAPEENDPSNIEAEPGGASTAP